MRCSQQVDALPCAERKFVAHDEDAQVHGGQRGADVRGHVVVAFAGVLEQRIPIRSEAGEESLQVATDLGVSIFLDEQRGGGVPQVQRGDASLQARLTHAGYDLSCHFGGAAIAGLDDEFVDTLAEMGNGF